ncbi:MAG: hypothetical protein LUG46_00725, partial [Erysipelotrichaceae bacterium]|nr:hypothetical protein [Erysipelotrichaceae bacterium]
QLAMSPSSDEIHKIYHWELSKSRVKRYNRYFYITFVVGIFFIVSIIGTSTQGDLIMHVILAIVFLALAFSAKRSQRKEKNLLENIKNGYFKVIHTTITKTKGQDDAGNLICEVADEDSLWGVKNSYSIHVGSPIIIAFDNNEWRNSYSEEMLNNV